MFFYSYKSSYHNSSPIIQIVLSIDQFLFNDRRNPRDRKYFIIIYAPTGTAPFSTLCEKNKNKDAL